LEVRDVNIDLIDWDLSLEGALYRSIHFNFIKEAVTVQLITNHKMGIIPKGRGRVSQAKN
jgi:hypothetical protein